MYMAFMSAILPTGINYSFQVCTLALFVLSEFFTLSAKWLLCSYVNPHTFRLANNFANQPSRCFAVAYMIYANQTKGAHQ